MIHTLKVERDVTVTKIALAGRMRAGKDAVANHLYIRHGFERVAFGDELKRTVYEVFPWAKTSPSKPRALYQQYGQLMREIDPDVWVHHVERRVAANIRIGINVGNDNIGVVISDVRQQNEYEWCRANGFTIIRVTAPDELRIERARKAGDAFTLDDLAHDTESHIDGFDVDYTVANDGSIEDLKVQVDDILAKISR